MYSVWCDGTLENEEVRRDLIVMDPQCGVMEVPSHPILGVVSGWAKSISLNENTRCCVRRESDLGIVYLSRPGYEMAIAEDGGE